MGKPLLAQQREDQRQIAEVALNAALVDVEALGQGSGDRDPDSYDRGSAIGLWVARTYAAALRPDLIDVPNEMVLVLLEDPKRFDAKLRIAERRARTHFVADGAPTDELSLTDWVQQRAEQWLIGASR